MPLAASQSVGCASSIYIFVLSPPSPKVGLRFWWEKASVIFLGADSRWAFLALFLGAMCIFETLWRSSAMSSSFCDPSRLSCSSKWLTLWANSTNKSSLSLSWLISISNLAFMSSKTATRAFVRYSQPLQPCNLWSINIDPFAVAAINSNRLRPPSPSQKLFVVWRELT